MDKNIVTLLLMLLPLSIYSQVDTTHKKVLKFYVIDNYKPDTNEVHVLKNKKGGKIIAYRRYNDQDWILVDTVATIQAILKSLPKSY